MCGSAPSPPPPPPVIMPPTQPDNSAQLNALTMQNQALQDQLNEMAQQQMEQRSNLQASTIGAMSQRQQQMAADTRGQDASDELKRGQRGRSSLRIRRTRRRGGPSGQSNAVNLPGGGGSASASASKKKRSGPNLPQY